MNTEAWHILSDWHSTWLAAATDQRDDLRAAFAIDHPELIQAADDLAAASGAIDGFLETPAMVLAARELVQEAPTLPEGTQVGPYRIVALLARGGMGDVYRATDLRLGRDVALKTLADAARGAGDGVERFLQEARITASLDHPNIVRVFDVGMSDARPFLVSELLDGETLRASIDRGPVAPESTRAIACAVASGLAAAHARGLVHRDLKPENIFVTRSGSIKILDFGIAKLAQDPALPRGLATLTGVLLGTAGYLAPEQVRGETVDARTDLFALGSILFELMTGQRAFVRGAHHRHTPRHRPRRSARPAPRGHLAHRHRDAAARQGPARQVSVRRRLAVVPGAARDERRAGEIEASAEGRQIVPARARRRHSERRRTGGVPVSACRRATAAVAAASVAGCGSHSVHLAPSRRVGARLRTDRVAGWTPYRLHGCRERRSPTPVRAVVRFPRRDGDCRHGWSHEAVLVARRNGARLLRRRQVDASGDRGRRAGRHLRCAGGHGGRVESKRDDRVLPSP